MRIESIANTTTMQSSKTLKNHVAQFKESCGVRVSVFHASNYLKKSSIDHLAYCMPYYH